MIKKNTEPTELDDELTEYPNEFYRKFFEKFSEIETIDASKYKVVHLISYFCKKYEETYKTKYQFKFNSPSPSKCFEVFQMKKLAMQLTSDPCLLKEYIDWVFLNKVLKAKRKLTSISFLTNEKTLKEYKLNVLFVNQKDVKIDRNTPLPEKYKSIFYGTKWNIETYGDLSFVRSSHELIECFNELEKIGFDKSVLERVS